MASPNDYSNLVQVIKKLDRRSKQVFVQVLIAEVSLDKSRNLGVQAGIMGAGASGSVAGGGMYDPFNALTNMLSTAGSGTGGISTLLSGKIGTKPLNVAAVVQALDSNGLLNVLSTPNILTSDNKDAEIFVGENIPFGGQSTVSSGIQTSSTERKDVGINLKIKPQISEGDYIRLDINQEISAVKEVITVGAGLTDRSTTKRSAKTSIVVKDNETIIIGGLIQDQEQEIVSKVPLLGDIPFLGWLFKYTSKKRNKTNLMIMLTPRIVKDDRDLAEMTSGQRLKFGTSVDNIKPLDVKKEISGK